METWIIRFVALICAAGGAALLWFFGVFAAVPWRESRWFALSGIEMQVLAASSVAGAAGLWGGIHLFSLADRAARPGTYALIRAAVLLAAFAAIVSGVVWAQQHGLCTAAAC